MYVRRLLVIVIPVAVVLTFLAATSAPNLSSTSAVLNSAIDLHPPYINASVPVNRNYCLRAVKYAEEIIEKAAEHSGSDSYVRDLIAKAKVALREARDRVGSYECLRWCRLASILGREALSYIEYSEGSVSRESVLSEVRVLELKLREVKDMYEKELSKLGGGYPTTYLLVEDLLSSAEDLLDQVPQILELSGRPEHLLISHASMVLEDARLRILDSEYLLTSGLGNSGRILRDVEGLYEKLHADVVKKLELMPEDLGRTLGNLTVQEVRSYVEQASLLYNRGYRLKAVTYLLVAMTYLNSLSDVSAIPDPWVSNFSVGASDVLKAKEEAVRAAERVVEFAQKSGVPDELLSHLLSSAYSDIDFADKSIQRCLELNEVKTSSLRYAYAFYVRANAYLKELEKTLEIVIPLLK
ncbi:MAG: hypothetical protein J7J11_03680 [Desulfurococcales archaeon]|nr:hypothetical protein [Desulfurococcales archaeon]